MPENRICNLDNDEITIDFLKIFNIIWYRKYTIIACYATIIILALLITFIMPKKYMSEAKLLINKSNYTNLAEINPFAIGNSPTDSSGGLSSIISGGNSGLNDDLSILKSDEVLNSVIRDNNLRYQNGERKGQYLLSLDLVNDKNLKLDTAKDGNIIEISYKSPDRKLAYNIVKSFIDSFSETYIRINTLKATRDNEFLENFYNDSRKALDKKTEKLKEYKSSSENNAIGSDIKVNNIYQLLLNQYDKRLQSQLKSIPSTEIENKKLEMDLEQEVTKLELLKKKYEWSKLVKALSENASKIEVLNNPILSTPSAYYEPKLAINILISLVVSFTIASIMIVLQESFNKKLVFSDLDTMYTAYSTIENMDYNDLILNTRISEDKTIGLISFLDNMQTIELTENLNKHLSLSKKSFLVISGENLLDEFFNKSSLFNQVIIVANIGKTNRKIFKTIYKAVKIQNKEIISLIKIS